MCFAAFIIRECKNDSNLKMAGRVTRSSKLPVRPLEQQARARWTTQLTKILADLMVEQVQKGNRKKNTFGKKEWRYICDEFFTKTSLRWDKEQLKNRYAVMRRQYVTVKAILDRDDFTWDETTGIIVATEELWAEYIREHPDAESIKTSGCPMYKELCIIFSEPKMDGKFDHSSARDTDFLFSYSEHLSTQVDDSSSESDGVDEVTGGRETSQPPTPISSCSRKRGRRGIEDAIAGAILEMAAASKLRTAAVQQRNARYTIADCIKELDELQGLEEQIYFLALDLFNKPNARETFLSLKKDKRFIWLQEKCTAHSVS